MNAPALIQIEALACCHDGVTRKSPKSHQTDAVSALCTELAVADRVTAILPCGTGKTLIALWLAEALATKTVIVLEPTLNLLRQNLHEWRRETAWTQSSWLAVCSDNMADVQPDAISISVAELDLPTTTDIRQVRDFLTAPTNGMKVVFCTYQSYDVIARAIPEGIRFDIGIFDEAHKTAGVEGKAFAQPLKDEVIPIAKRVFFTATPKHSDIRPLNGEIEEIPVYSMNDTRVYGRVAYHLTHRQAVERGVIVDYKVVISVVTRADIDHELLTQGKLHIDDDTVSLRHLAHQIAIAQACESYGLRKAITFHNRIDSAGRFQTDCERHGIWPRGQAPRCFHVNGDQTSAERARTLESFRDAEFSLVTNARCLTEGIDVPNVDLVAFLSPRRSLIDVVQAVGRAMRTAPGKQYGYILLPLYLEVGRDESIDEAIARSDLSEIRDVLQALKEQDEILVEAFQRRRTVEKRRTSDGGMVIDLSANVSLLSHDITLVDLQDSIATRVLEQFSTSWDQYYQQLVVFKEKHGHCRVPRAETECTGFSGWVSRQRRYYKSKTLSAERIALLEKIGFVWGAYEDSWRRNLTGMQQYIKLSGDSEPPYGNPAWRPLNIWAGKLRKRYAARTLSPEQISDLEFIGFAWNPGETRWHTEANRLLAALIEAPGKQIPHDLYTRAKAWYQDNERTWRKQSASTAQLTLQHNIGLLLHASCIEDLTQSADAGTVDNRTYVARHQRLILRLEVNFAEEVRQLSFPLVRRYRDILEAAGRRDPDDMVALTREIQSFLDTLNRQPPPAADTLRRMSPELQRRGFRKKSEARVDADGLRLKIRRPDQIPLWRDVRNHLFHLRSFLLELSVTRRAPQHTMEIHHAS